MTPLHNAARKTPITMTLLIKLLALAATIIMMAIPPIADTILR